jgi:hypothetical protein
MKEIKNLFGERFGRLECIRPLLGEGFKRITWRCICDCGNYTNVSANSLIMGNTKSCGCYKSEKIRETHKIDIQGRVYGLLTALKPDGKIRGCTAWLCQCECGKQKRIPIAALNCGNSKSCGSKIHSSLVTEAKKLNELNKTEYMTWSAMKDRCKNPKNKSYKYYGGRGIEVCERWEKFENFLEDMGKKPEGYSIERVDVNGNYDKLNCKWVPKSEQSQNKRNNRYLTYLGKTQNLADWVIETGLTRSCIEQRLKRGWTVEKTLSTSLL